jgi:hypothetical protein
VKALIPLVMVATVPAIAAFAESSGCDEGMQRMNDRTGKGYTCLDIKDPIGAGTYHVDGNGVRKPSPPIATRSDPATNSTRERLRTPNTKAQ